MKSSYNYMAHLFVLGSLVLKMHIYRVAFFGQKLVKITCPKVGQVAKGAIEPQTPKIHWAWVFSALLHMVAMWMRLLGTPQGAQVRGLLVVGGCYM